VIRKYHKLFTAKKLVYPAAVIFIDTETTTIETWQKQHRPELIVGVAEFHRLNKDLIVTESDLLVFTHVFDLWVWISNIIPTTKDLTIYAHNWSFDFPVIDGLSEMDGLGYKIESIIDGCPPVIINFIRAGHKVRFIDSMNYFKSSLAEMGNTLGIAKGFVKFNNRYSNRLIKYCKRDVVILRESMFSLFRYLKDNDLSRLTHTVSSLALSIYIRKFLKQPIYIDADEKRTKVGRDSYYGGRTEAFKIGKFEGPFYLIDVNSQYPFWMSAIKYPYKTIAHYKHVSIRDLEGLLDRYAITADVEIDTDVSAYPRKLNGRTCFPVGTFRTVLSTPEVRYALAHNHIKKVYSALVHEHDFLFKEYVEYFYNQRMKNKKAGNEQWQQFDKLLLNTLYGKFGQTYKEWVKSPLAPRGYPHTRHTFDADTNKNIYIMELNGEVYMATTDTESRDSFPAIAAHVTAAGRIQIQETIDFIGKDNVYYCDTDSLLLNYRGYDKIKKFLDDNVLGCWGMEDDFADIDIKGCKDYRFGQVKKIKGVKHNAEQIAPGVYEQLQFATLRGIIRSESTDSPMISHMTKTLTRKYYKGHVLENGDVSPFVLIDGELSA